MMVEEAHCGVAAALIGSQGVEMHVSPAAMDHGTGRCWRGEVSADRGGKYLDHGCDKQLLEIKIFLSQ